jgi:hypothetical protein
MRFLRRSGRDDELPVERGEVPGPDEPETQLALDDVMDAATVDADAEAEPDSHAEAEAEDEADDPASHAEAEAEAIHEADVAPEAEAAAGHDSEAETAAEAGTEPEAEAHEAGDAEDAPDASEAAAEAGADVAADAGEAEADLPHDEPIADAPIADAPVAAIEPIADAEGLSGLVAGGVRVAVPATHVAEDLGPDPLAEGRPATLRLAGLHLRTGQYALARAELEALAGRGRLDDEATLDLAEVRWRTGDLAGAGDTANVLLARGQEPALALVIAAEAVAAAGRPTEARRLSARALEVADGPLDPLFAGMPRAMIWPVAVAPEPAVDASRRRSRKPRAEGDGAPTTASEAFAGGRAALARGDASRAGLLLGVAMRLEPGFAEDVLRAVTGRDDQPILALVRGDALRLLGREAEALEAFDRARGRSAAVPAADEPSGPGLFDDDQG